MGGLDKFCDFQQIVDAVFGLLQKCFGGTYHLVAKRVVDMLHDDAVVFQLQSEKSILVSVSL